MTIVLICVWFPGMLWYGDRNCQKRSCTIPWWWYSMILLQCPSAVREITKSSSTFSATNICINIVWVLQLHDTIQMKSNYTRINYNHDKVAIRSHMMIYNFVWNFIFTTKFSSIYLSKGEKRLVFRLSFVNLHRVKDGTHMFDANKYIYMCLWYKSHQIACLVSHPINHFSKWMLTV